MNFEICNNWRLFFEDPDSGKAVEIPAQVPGNVYGDLIRSGIAPDPYYSCNSMLFRKYEFIDWEYKNTFIAPSVQNGERIIIRFEGVDTVFELYINGKFAGSGKNMFIEHSFDITDFVNQNSENQISVKIRSSVNYARQFDRYPGTIAMTYNFEGLFVRRAMHTYGWDIAPRLVGAGLWRKVVIETLAPERWTDVYLCTTKILPDGSAQLVLDWNFVTPRKSLENFSAVMTMKCGDSEEKFSFTPYFVTGTNILYIKNPKLWNVRGHGEQNLYDVELTLFHEGKFAAVKKFRTGIRTIDLVRSVETEPVDQREFKFVVNNKPVFIKGSNWVPFTSLHGEENDRMEKSLRLFIELECNAVRCWGGGVYEDDYFFDFCDREGLLVWQDFMIACEFAPSTEDFKEEVRIEAESVIRKLRQHPSLALWCGDNECDEVLFWHPQYKKILPSDNQVSRKVLREAVLKYDPVRDYLPSSPFNPDSVKTKGGREFIPEQHTWGARDNYKCSFYMDTKAIFASETGYHGMPAPESVRKFIPEEAWNDREKYLDCLVHSSQPFGDTKGVYSYRFDLMANQIRNLFGTAPEDLETFSKASQIVQAEAVKTFIELFRMDKYNKTGIMWWNVIDCWPQFSDAVVDYYFVRKLACGYIRRAQQEVLLSFTEPANWMIRLMGVNDLDREVKVAYTVREAGSKEIFLQGEKIIPADASIELDTLKMSVGEQKMYIIEYEYDGRKTFNHYTQGFPPFNLQQYQKWQSEFDSLARK